jgi:type II secretory pathway pseudopilin PulG
MLIPTIIAIAPAFSTAEVSARLFGVAATEAGTAASLAMWQVTLIVAAITAIIAIVAILVSQQESAEKRAKEAAKAAEAAVESLEEAKRAADALKDSFSGYNEAVDKLKKCTKGTKEWEAALRDANNAALEVIENLPSNLTADEVKNLYTTENGYMELKSDEIEKYQSRADNNAMAAQMSKAVADKVVVDTAV